MSVNLHDVSPGGTASPLAAQVPPPPAPMAPPSIALPTGDGALRGLGKTSTADPARGTSTLTVPLPVSPARSSFHPQLQLTYDSAAGYGPFCLGWDVALPSVGRRTDNGLPHYDHATESDVFVRSGSDDLDPGPVARRRRRGRSEWERTPGGRRDQDRRLLGAAVPPSHRGAFARIERWTCPDDPTDVQWQTLSRDNVATVFGADAQSRITDPDDPTHVACWLICASHDDPGSEIRYEYRPEDGAGVDPGRSSERHRPARPTVPNRYLTHAGWSDILSPPNDGSSAHPRRRQVVDKGHGRPPRRTSGGWGCR